MPPISLPIHLARRSAVAAAAASTASMASGGDDGDHASCGGQSINNHHSENTVNNPTGCINDPTSGDKKPDRPPRFHPSIFRYTCRGKLSLNSHTHNHHAGVCHGIQSHLEHIDHWRTTTEDEAIQWFQSKAAWADATAAAAAAQQEGDAAHAIQTAHISNVLVYPPTSESSAAATKKATAEEWSCYGTTEVDLLVLRPENAKEETIAAVSPYCAPGMTIRDVHLDHGKDRTSTIRLGILEILYQTTIDDDDDDLLDDAAEEEAVDMSTDSNTEETQKSRKKKKSDKKQYDDEEKEDHVRLGYPTRFWNSLKNVAKHMQMNAHILYQATQEDFLGRTFSASERIVQEFPKQLHRTVDLMRKVITWDWEPPPDEDAPGGPADGGAGPPPLV